MCLDNSMFNNRGTTRGNKNNPGSAEEARSLLTGSTPHHTKYAVVNLHTSKNRRNSFDHNLITPGDTNCNGVLPEGDMNKVAGSLRDMAATIVNNAKREQIRKQLKSEWVAVAKVLDRSFFVLYIFAIGLSLAFMFPKPD